MVSGAPQPLGRLRDGRTVHGWRFGASDGLQAQVWSFGALLASLSVPGGGGRRVEVLQGPVDLAGAEAGDGHHGVVVGPVANRVAGARFSLDGREHRLAPNEGPNLLHSGSADWGRKVWRFADASPGGCTLRLETAAGEGGFPGGARAEVTFALAGDTLRIDWRAEVDAPTPIAPTHHLYFDLSGGADPDVRAHTLQVDAPAFLPVRADMVPEGELRPVAGGALDLRRPRPLGEVLAADDAQLRRAGGLDHCFAFDPRAGGRAVLHAPSTGLRLELRTDQPGLQVYTGQHLNAPFRPFSAVALEPEGFPDAVNRPGFPPVIARPGAPFRGFASYRLGLACACGCG